MKRYAHIIGTGSQTPKRVLTNAEIEKMVDTSDEWITSRSGIKERHIVSDNEASSDLASAAAVKALAAAGIDASAIDLIILATVTPDKPLPSTSCFVQENIGAVNAAAMDIVAACSGFVYGLSLARGVVETGQADNVLVIGVEVLSRITNWKDRNTCVLFGDGAGAAVVQGSNSPGGILGTYMKSNGSLWHLLNIPGGGYRTPIDESNLNNGARYIHMAGPEVYKNAVRAMEEAGIEALKRTGLRGEDIALFIPHQANIRIIESTADKLDISMDKVFVNIHKYGNTSAASIPIALDEAIRSGRLKKKDKALMVAFGAGFTWGSAVVEI